MIKEILQPDIVGLSFGDDYCESAPGFENTNVIWTLDPHYHSGYKRHALSFNKVLKGNENVFEIGCGSGNLSYFIRQIYPNITYVTIDINATTPHSPYIKKDTHFTAYTDRPYKIVKEDKTLLFDYILSFEHFEHIDPSRLDIFFQNIKNHCHGNTKIIATASTQIVPPHVSVFDKKTWSEIIERNGFQMLDEVYLTPENCPPNFPFSETLELIFKLKNA